MSAAATNGAETKYVAVDDSGNELVGQIVPSSTRSVPLAIVDGRFVPNNLDSLWRLAVVIQQAGIAPKDMATTPRIAIALASGMEIGLTPMQSVQSIAVINGRPAIWGDAALALVLSSPVCEDVAETMSGSDDARVATCVCKRKGRPTPVSVSFSVADAKRAGLWGKAGPWTQYPERMLRYRARGFALRDAFADILKGLVTAEEAEDYPTVHTTARVVGNDAINAVVSSMPAAEKQAPAPEPQRVDEPRQRRAAHVVIDEQGLVTGDRKPEDKSADDAFAKEMAESMDKIATKRNGGKGGAA